LALIPTFDKNNCILPKNNDIQLFRHFLFFSAIWRVTSKHFSKGFKKAGVLVKMYG